MIAHYDSADSFQRQNKLCAAVFIFNFVIHGITVLQSVFGADTNPRKSSTGMSQSFAAPTPGYGSSVTKRRFRVDSVLGLGS